MTWFATCPMACKILQSSGLQHSLIWRQRCILKRIFSKGRHSVSCRLKPSLETRGSCRGCITADLSGAVHPACRRGASHWCFQIDCPLGALILKTDLLLELTLISMRPVCLWSFSTGCVCARASTVRSSATHASFHQCSDLFALTSAFQVQFWLSLLLIPSPIQPRQSLTTREAS